MQERRNYERKYNKSKLAVDRELYCHQRDKYNNLLNTTKQDYFKNKIESATSTKELFEVCNNLLNRTNENVLPSHSCGTELANRFVNYFGVKIKSISQDLEDSSNTPDYTINVANDFDGVPLDKFRIVSQEEVRKIISSSPSKSCSLDPILTSILKLCLDELTPVLTLVVNTFLEFADFSPEFKSLCFTTPKKGHTWFWNFKELSACFEPFFLIQTCRTHCMCAACRSSESSPSVWSLSISISSTAQHWDSSPTSSEWPPSDSRHSWGSNTRSTRSQCCIWYAWPSALTSYTGIIIWCQRQGFGLVPIVSNRSHSNSSDQEINIWAARVEIWCATGFRSGPHSIHHLHHTTGPTHQEAWSDFPSICRRYPALFSI